MNFLRQFLFFLLLALLSLPSYAQRKISGEVVDESDKAKLKQASVMLLQAKDSILVDFARVQENGKFLMQASDTLDYLLIVSYPKFGEYFQTIKKGNTDVALGEIALQSAARLIEEVLITGKIPVVIKGDTTEYDASSFVTEKNAKVEDLLRVLPGISVDASGKITAQGKTVEKVLVDGEEFFGDDPTLVTRNIRSDMVDKVQVYEKKSEQAERTGVDDGQRVQTINVKLREDAKNGMFGKVDAGGGLDSDNGYYVGKLLFNKFNGSQKIGVYGITSNDGDYFLNWKDQERLGINESVVFGTGSVMVFGSSDPFSSWDGRGHPQALTGGVTYQNDWKDKKHKLSSNYKYGQIKNDTYENTISQNSTASSILDQNTTKESNVDANRHKIMGKYDVAIDSLTTLTVKMSAEKTQSEQFSGVTGETQRNNSLVSTNFSDQQANSTKDVMTYDAYLTRKLRKAGRSLSLSVRGSNEREDGDLKLNSELHNRVNDSKDIIDQLKDLQSTTSNLATSISYTEPLSARWRADITYDFTQGLASTTTSSYNKGADGKYSDFDEEFSNDFDFETRRNAATLNVFYKTDKVELNIMNRLRYDDMFQKNILENNKLSRDYTTYNPGLRFRYNLNKNKSIHINLDRTSDLPNLSQIQPLRQNTDQMNQTIGNENLKPSSRNNIGFNYTSFDILKGKFVYMGGNYSLTENQFSQNVIVFSDGTRVMMADNMDKNSQSLNYYSGYGFDLYKKLQIKSMFGLNASYSTNYNRIQEIDGSYSHDFLFQSLRFEDNKNTNMLYGANFGFERQTTKGFDFRMKISPSWNLMRSTFTPDQNSEGFVLNGTSDFTLYLPKKFQFYGNANYQYEAPTKVYAEKFERLLFSPGLRKKFLKNESLTLDFQVKDLFNQNKGYNRSQSASSFTQQTYTTISRYFMLKASWDFTSMKVSQ